MRKAPLWQRVANRLRRALRLRPRVGSRLYAARVAEELEHYSRLHTGPGAGDPRLIEPSPPVWEEIQRRTQQRIRDRTGRDLLGHLVSSLNRRPASHLLSLGCGPGGVELAVARESPQSRITGIDLNPAILELGRAAAAAEALPVEFCHADLNTADLPAAQFDVVFCHAALHHLIELERLFLLIRRALRPEGELVVLDLMTPNGYLMSPATRRAARAVWSTLPERLRLNHTGYLPEKRTDRKLWEVDTRTGHGMECARSGEIVPLLHAHFRETCFVPLLALCRRFFDTMYGPNYDLASPLDRAILEWIWQLDVHALDSGALPGESFFGIYRRPD